MDRKRCCHRAPLDRRDPGLWGRLGHIASLTAEDLRRKTTVVSINQIRTPEMHLVMAELLQLGLGNMRKI